MYILLFNIMYVINSMFKLILQNIIITNIYIYKYLIINTLNRLF